MNISVKGDASQVQNYLRLYVTMSDVSEYSSLDQMRKQLMNEFMKTDNEQSFDLFSSSSESGISQRVDNPVEESDEGFESGFEYLAEVDDFDVDDVDEVRDPEEAWEKTFEVEDVEDVESVENGESNIDEAEFYYDSDGFLAVKGTDLELEEAPAEDNSEPEDVEIEGNEDFEDVEEVVDEEDFDDWGSWGDESEEDEINEEYVEEVVEEPVEVADEVIEEAVETSSRFPTDKSAMGGLGYVRDTYKLDEMQSLPPMREFVKKNPQISKLEVIELYGSKEVQKQLKLGKVYERKGRLFI